MSVSESPLCGEASTIVHHQMASEWWAGNPLERHTSGERKDPAFLEGAAKEALFMIVAPVADKKANCILTHRSKAFTTPSCFHGEEEPWDEMCVLWLPNWMVESVNVAAVITERYLLGSHGGTYFWAATVPNDGNASVYIRLHDLTCATQELSWQPWERKCRNGTAPTTLNATGAPGGIV